jgi:glutamate-1-semialdehyde 2,1-aminomutase
LTRSEELYKRAKRLIPGGVNSPVRAYEPYPFFTKTASGSHIIDVDENDYVDYCLGFGPLILGHSHPKIVEAVKAQLVYGSLYGTPTEQEIDLAELVSEVVPSAEMVRLVSTGSEATMAATRVARGFTGKKKIIKFEGCYHGSNDYMLVKAGSGATTFGMPDSLGIPKETTRNTIVVPFNDIEKLERAIKENKNDLAAVIVEPVMGNMGVILPKIGFLQALRELTEAFGVVLIFDEVITGFRLAIGGAQEYFNVKPDMTALGKILGGGFPMAAYVGKEEIMRMIAPSGKVYQSGTFSGNPVSVAAGLATLRFLRGEGESFYKRLEAKCSKVVEPLLKVVRDFGLKVQINHVASMFQLFFTDRPVIDYASAKASDNKLFMRLHSGLLDGGVFLAPSQYETCFLSVAHSAEDLGKTVACFSSLIQQF